MILSTNRKSRALHKDHAKKGEVLIHLDFDLHQPDPAAVHVHRAHPDDKHKCHQDRKDTHEKNHFEPQREALQEVMKRLSDDIVNIICHRVRHPAEENPGVDPKRDSHAGKLLADAAGWNSGPSTSRE
jgi:hypothetical protein